jgi:hypothetical protein
VLLSTPLCCIKRPKSSDTEKENVLAQVEWLPVTSRPYTNVILVARAIGGGTHRGFGPPILILGPIIAF